MIALLFTLSPNLQEEGIKYTNESCTYDNHFWFNPALHGSNQLEIVSIICCYPYRKMSTF